MSVDITSIPNAFENRLGLPHPNWSVVYDWVESNIAKDDYHVVWALLAQQWLEQLSHALSANYTILQSDEFFLLSAAESETSDRLLYWCETFRERILDLLSDVASDQGQGKHVVLAFHTWEAYYDYVADFYPDAGEFELSSGFFLDRGYAHIAICTQSDDQHDRTIAHELTHTLLCHLPLPRWLNEGVTQVIEGLVVGSSYFMMDGALAQRHRSYWNEESIHHFWSGDSFFFPGDASELSYSLAEVLFRNLMSDHPSKAFKFLNGACFSDAGNEALNQCCGISLTEHVSQFLGNGNWTPRSDYNQM